VQFFSLFQRVTNALTSPHFWVNKKAWSSLLCILHPTFITITTFSSVVLWNLFDPFLFSELFFYRVYLEKRWTARDALVPLRKVWLLGPPLVFTDLCVRWSMRARLFSELIPPAAFIHIYECSCRIWNWRRRMSPSQFHPSIPPFAQRLARSIG
jgi:hypothetical protein